MTLLTVQYRAQWRAWLRKNAARSEEIWLVYFKKNSGRTRISYEDAVEEALCFGWIDGKIQRLDDDRYAQRFTPRKPNSRWSASNIRRVNRLIAQKQMTATGLAVFRPDRATAPHPTQLPKALEAHFKKHAEAWRNFQNFPPAYRRLTTGWVASAKKEETQLKRLEKLIEYSMRNEKIPFM